MTHYSIGSELKEVKMNNGCYFSEVHWITESKKVHIIENIDSERIGDIYILFSIYTAICSFLYNKHRSL